MPKIKVKKKGVATYPADHQAGMKVPKGGSCCQNCRFWDGEDCENEYFRKWNGSKYIPAPPDQFCSDWWMPKKS